VTFCVGINVEGGLVGLADTRVTSGTECITARKVSVFTINGCPMFLMTSGLRSVRDKALTYFEEVIQKQGSKFDRLFRAVNALAEQIRIVAKEDKEALSDSGLTFNFHAIVGGQLKNDVEQKLYLVYPQGNWVEIGPGTPYSIIGSTGYGKPVLDRTLNHGDSMAFALRIACLAFDSTRISAADVDFPIDIILYKKNTFQLTQRRMLEEDLAPISQWWQERLRESVKALPAEWQHELFEEVERTASIPNGRSARSAQKTAPKRPSTRKASS